MKTFSTYCGKEYTLDDEDYMVAVEHAWMYRRGYIFARINGKNIFLHRLLTNARPGEIVDHIDGNPLNNQKHNLRICTAKQSTINRKPYAKNRYLRGVRLAKNGVEWEAYIKIGKDSHNLGRYKTEAEACQAYNDIAQTLHGEYARLYVIPEKDHDQSD